MPATITITCPACKKSLKGPAEIEGRKIRCKLCNHTFVAKTVAAASAKAAPSPSSPPVDEEMLPPTEPPGAPPIPVKAKKTEEAKKDEPAPLYDFVADKTDNVARCPQCAYEMESEEAIVCLKCGYNLLTRKRLEMVKTYQTTFMDWVFWLSLPILNAVIALFCVFLIVFLWLLMPNWFPDSWFNGLFVQIYGSVMLAFIGWITGKYAFKKLVYEFRPPEKIKR